MLHDEFKFQTFDTIQQISRDIGDMAKYGDVETTVPARYHDYDDDSRQVNLIPKSPETSQVVPGIVMRTGRVIRPPNIFPL